MDELILINKVQKRLKENLHAIGEAMLNQWAQLIEAAAQLLDNG